MAPFRLGLVGAGRMGQTHLRALSGSRRVEVVAIAEPSASICAALAFPSSGIHPDLDTMLRAGGLDGVLIATPSGAHLASIEAVAGVGLPILCEKPCGLSAAEARRAANIAAKAGVPLQVAYWRRFVPALQSLKARIEEGALGELYLAACHQWDEMPPRAAFRLGGGGAFSDMGVHEFDQLRWLTGQEIAAVQVATSAVAYDGHFPEDPDAATVLCQLSGGASGLVTLGRRFPLGDACWLEVFGTQGFEDCRFLWPPEGDAVFMTALVAQAEAFAAAALGAPATGATAEDAVAALDAAERCGAQLKR